MLVASLVICGVVLIAMVLRFVQPKLLYGLRRFLREVGTNKATLDYEAGRRVANREFVAALMRGSRPETEEATASAARRRANKVRELYRILESAEPASGWDREATGCERMRRRVSRPSTQPRSTDETKSLASG